MSHVTGNSFDFATTEWFYAENSHLALTLYESARSRNRLVRCDSFRMAGGIGGGWDNGAVTQAWATLR